MSDKLRKTSEDMSFSLSRWFRKLSTNAPSTFIVTVTVLAYAIFLFGGGLYTLINQPVASYYTESGGFMFLYPDISSQFGADTVVASMLYAMGFIGMLFMYQSAKNASKPRQAYMLMVAGVAFLLLSYIFLEGAISYKLSG